MAKVFGNMSSNYYLIHRSFSGTVKTILTPSDWFKLEYIKKENDFGSLYLDLPPIYDANHFLVDDRLEVMMSVEGGSFVLDMDSVWFIRLMRFKIDENNKEFIHILAYDATQLLNRRIVAYPSGTAYSGKLDKADDMIKAIARENFGTLASDTNRDISEYMSIDPDYSLCPEIEKSFAWRKVLPLLQEIADDSNTNGTYLSFDIVYDTDSKVRLKTYVGCRGVNRGLSSGNPLVVSIDNGVLSYASVTFDHTEEFNFIYAGGRGEGVNRILATAYDNARINMSPYNRVEDWVDSSNDDNENTPESEANSRLKECAPKISINGHMQQTPSKLYNIDFGYGDIIVAKYKNFMFDVHLDTINVIIDSNGKPELKIYSRNLDDTEY